MNRMPEGMPVLSAGRHRTPKHGACFMEFASYLAGERWSDHPACTHPTVAALARDVNDVSSDAGRALLTTLIPRVVGLTVDDPQFGMAVALRAARAALPVASMERQRALAVALLSFDPELGPESRAAFAQSPDLEGWARAYLASSRFAPKASARTAEAIVHTAVTGIAKACIEDPDARLRALLAETIAAAEAARAPLTERQLEPVR
ncbi:MAG: hypothetical protein KKH51_15220 [Actinobacteria bacterium]|nr:hypothetical protein [Actinomycetota bacterium]